MEQLPEVDIFQSNKRDSLGCGKLAALNQAVFKDVAYVSLPEGKGEEMVLEMARAPSLKAVLISRPGLP